MVTPPSERRLVYALAAVQFTVLLDFMVLMPLGAELMRDLALTAGQFGALVSSYTVASALSGLAGALWLDRWERRRAVFALYALFAVTTAGCGLSPSIAWLAGFRLAAGAAAGLLWSAAMALLADTVPGERRGRALGTVLSSYAVSAVAGVPAGLFVGGRLGWRATFIGLAALSAVVLWALARVLRGTAGGAVAAASAGSSTPDGARPGAEPRVPLDAARPPLLFSAQNARGWLLTFLVVFAAFLMIPYLGPFMAGNLDVGPSRLPWVYFSGGAATFVTVRLIGALVDRHGGAPVLAMLLVATLVPHLVFTHLSRTPFPYVVGAFVLFMTLTSGRMIPTLALLTARVAPDARGRFLSVNTAVGDAASGLAAWISGLLLHVASDGRVSGFGRVGWISAGVTATALLALRAVARNATTPGESSVPGAPEVEAS